MSVNVRADDAGVWDGTKLLRWIAVEEYGPCVIAHGKSLSTLYLVSDDLFRDEMYSKNAILFFICTHR